MAKIAKAYILWKNEKKIEWYIIPIFNILGAKGYNKVIFKVWRQNHPWRNYTGVGNNFERKYMLIYSWCSCPHLLKMV